MVATGHRTEERETSRIRLGGHLCLWAGVLGAAAAAGLLAVPAQVEPGQFSYPLDPIAFTGVQTGLAIQHLGLIAGLVALAAAGIAGPGRLARIGQLGALLGVGLLTVMEVVAITIAPAAVDGPEAGLVNTGYGVASVLSGVSLTLVGIAVLRAHRAYGLLRVVPLLLGVWAFIPMMPALASGSYVAARLAIGGWMLLFALLGWGLVRITRTS